MAAIVPSRIPSSATRGEQKLHEILGRLPADWVVYYEPNLEGRHPDFVVISPDHGILIIEDKHWRPSTILAGSRSEIAIRATDGRRVTVRHPEAQVRSYLFHLKDIASSVRYGRRFLHHDGMFAGQFRIPIATLVSLSNITSSQFEDPERAISPIFDPEITVLRDDLDRWATMSPKDLEAEVGGYFRSLWPIPRLIPDEVRALRAIIHPEIDFENAFSPTSLLAESESVDDQQQVLRTLDLRQEDAAQALGEGHRILFGVAGSGKTVILITRARLLAMRSPESKILLTCYNRELSAWIAKQVSDCPQIVVSTFHKLCIDNGLQFSRERSDQDWGRELGQRLHDGSRDAARFDAILVDEAQDFEPCWFHGLLAMAKDPEDGDFLIVADGAQGLYRRSRLSWRQLGIRAVGRTHSKRFDLDRNYRNSSEILALADTFAAKTEASIESDEDGIRSVRIDVKTAVRSTGASPLIFRRRDWKDELATAECLVSRLIDGRWLNLRIPTLAPREIAVLYPRATGPQKLALAALTNRLMAHHSSPDGEGVNVQTIHSAKGLQYRAVILLWAGAPLPFVEEAQKMEIAQLDRRLLYVGMTRAESFLAITSSADSETTRDLIRSSASEVIERAIENTIFNGEVKFPVSL